jgi:quinol monooxygenase YgiN
MTFVNTATYVCKPGEAEPVLEALTEVAPLSRAESGCIEYRVQRSVEDPHVFLLYEIYRDRDAFDAHANSEHFDAIVRKRAWPHLKSRTVFRGEPLDI